MGKCQIVIDFKFKVFLTNSKDAKEDEEDVVSKPGIDRLLININFIKLNNKILFLHFKCSHFKFIKLK